MKVLIADRGTEPSDFAYTVPAELVMLGAVCARDEQGDGGCGCGRSFVGLASRKSTTVARVVDMPGLDLETLTGVVTDSLVAAGWTDVDEWAAELAEDIADEAASWPEDQLLRRHMDDLEPA